MTSHSISPELEQGFTRALQTGEETKVRQFLADHFKELPEDLQDDLIVALVEEALGKHAREDEAMDSVQKQGLAAFNLLDRAKEEIQKHRKLGEIRKDIQNAP
jgi:hypothetical protein